jgi:hypothetical protein
MRPLIRNAKRMSAETVSIPDIVCISGQQWLPYSYFKIQYEGPIVRDFERGCHFVLGDDDGIERHAQELLDRLCAKKPEHEKRITIYNVGEDDLRLNPNFKLINGFATHQKRGEAMTAEATRVICVLAAFGAVASGSLLDVLAIELHDQAAAERVCAILRRHSESKSAFQSVLTKVTPVYRSLYDPQAIEMKFAEDMSAQMGMTFVRM